MATWKAWRLPVPERVPPPYAPDRARQIEAIFDIRPAVLTLHLGDMTAETVSRLRDLGVRIGGSATSVREARHLEALGLDFIIAQGMEAGGHRGTFLHVPEHVMTGTLALVRQVVRAVRVPVVAAGGIMDGAGIAAVLALGAQAAQMGTAFLLCPESAASEVHRKAIENMDGDETTITRAFTGKPARGVRNRFIEEAERATVPFLPFPGAAEAHGAPARGQRAGGFARSHRGMVGASGLARAAPSRQGARAHAHRGGLRDHRAPAPFDDLLVDPGAKRRIAAMDGVHLRRLAAHEITLHREVRLRALREAPDSFADTFADAAARPASYWETSRARSQRPAATQCSLPARASTSWARSTGYSIRSGTRRGGSAGCGSTLSGEIVEMESMP